AQTNLVSYPYTYVNGAPAPTAPHTPTGFGKQIIENRQTILINDHLEERAAEVGSLNLGDNPSSDPEPEGSFLGVPMVVGNNVIGLIALGSEPDQAFRDSDVRLLSTLAASLGVAL